ncbi:DsbG Protein-disulfide isomerase [Candidatus Nanopelagicaceae bacterium]
MNAKSQPGKDNFTRNLVIGVVLGVVLIMLVPTVISKQTKTSAKIPANVSAERGYGIVFNGDLKGVPVLDLYEDFQCPSCARFEGTQGQYLESLIADKKATVVFHTLSFIGTESIIAANAGACSADEGKFLALHKMLYQTQPQENSGAWTTEALIAAGGSVGIKSKAYKDCVTNGTYADWVTNVQTSAAKADVNSTPTVFINGKQLDRNAYYDPALFIAAVERG